MDLRLRFLTAEIALLTAFAGFVTACVVVGIILGMGIMYGWLALNGEIKSLTDAVSTVLLMAV